MNPGSSQYRLPRTGTFSTNLISLVVGQDVMKHFEEMAVGHENDPAGRTRAEIEEAGERTHPSCVRCQVYEGQGWDSGSSLTGNLQSIVGPHAVIFEGLGEVSAMPNMNPLFGPRE